MHNISISTRISMIILLLACWAGSSLALDSVTSGFWDEGATWGGTPPTSSDDVVILDGDTVTIRTNTAISVQSLTIRTNGVLTHTANTTTALGERYKVVLDIANDLTIDLGGEICADGMGYARDQGLGTSTGPDGSASYGGIGDAHSTTYGSITTPTNIGSGGSAYYDSTPSQNGGGAIQLSVGGTATVNGAISASGVCYNYYAGSGGSVFLTAGTLTGSGTGIVRANGGSSTVSAGGGGRVAVILTHSADFDAVDFQAFAGATSRGAGGTVYLEDTNHIAGQGRLIVNYGDLAPYNRADYVTLQNGSEASAYAFSEIILTNGGVYALDTNDTLDVTATTIHGDPDDTYDGLLVSGDTLTVPASFGLTNYFVTLDTNATFNPTTLLVIGTNAVLTLNAPMTLSCTVTSLPGSTLMINAPFTLNNPLTVGLGATTTVNAPFTLNGTLTVESGGLVTHSANGTIETYKMDISIQGDLDVQTGGNINADGKGYQEGQGPGRSRLTANASGAAHGGMGAIGTAGTYGSTYGSITAPTNIGSGGDDCYTSKGARGGGAVRLRVTGATTVDGTISAMGVAGVGVRYYAGGAGGSLFLTTATLSGNGLLCANGGDMTSSKAGGGGRIAVIVTNAPGFGEVKMHAFSGKGYSTIGYGAPGTVYMESTAYGTGNGLLRIDASNLVSTATTLIDSNVTDTVVGTMILTNAAVLALGSNQTLTVNGSWNNAATFVAGSNSTVILASTNVATVTANNTFYNLTAGAAGKTIQFEAGKTNTVNGKLTFLDNTTLLSTQDGVYTYLVLSPGGSQEVGGVTVKDNHAGTNSGQQILPKSGSYNLNHNVNWVFPARGTVIAIR